MKAETLDLVHIFEPTYRYHVPLFQRPYVWEREKQWAPLWEDVRTVADRLLDGSATNDDIPHFMGAVVLAQPPVAKLAELSPRLLIDGQQRLTTLQLMVAAARVHAAELEETTTERRLATLLFIEDFLAPDPDDRLKLIPTNADRTAFRNAIERDGGGPAPDADASIKTLDAYHYFRGEIGSWLLEDGAHHAAIRVAALARALRQLLRIVVISLEPEDNAQAIFETMNARGTPLLAADLVKNHVFRRIQSEGLDEERVYRSQWQRFDRQQWRREVGQGRARRPRIDVFLGHWLVMASADEAPWQELFIRFRDFTDKKYRDVQGLLTDVSAMADVFDGFDEFQVGTREQLFFYRLNALESSAFMPPVLQLFGPSGIQSDADRRMALWAMESWLVRRLLCRLTTKNYNQVAIGLVKQIASAQAPSSETVIEHLRSLSGDSQLWPSDDLLAERVRTTPYYTALSRGRTRMVLEALEDELRGRFAPRFQDWGALSIEHILPQEWSAHWPLAASVDPLGGTIERDAAKHRLGNLTLVTQPLNSLLSNAAWIADPGAASKREALTHYNTFFLNKSVVERGSWDEGAIAERTEALLTALIRIWPGPTAEIWGEPVGDSAGAVAEATVVSDVPGVVTEASPLELDIESIVANRADGPFRPVVRSLLRRVTSELAVELRAQKSKNEPTYVQVRASHFPQVMAYVNVFASSMRIDYRLPTDHPTTADVQRRQNFYGIALLIQDMDGVNRAMSLMHDAFNRREGATVSPAEATWSPQTWLGSYQAAGGLPEVVPVLEAWARENRASISYSGGAKTGALRVWFGSAGTWFPLFYVLSKHEIELQFDTLAKRPVFDDPQRLGELARRLGLPSARGFPKVPAAILEDEDSRGPFLDAFAWAVGEIAAGMAEGPPG